MGKSKLRVFTVGWINIYPNEIVHGFHFANSGPYAETTQTKLLAVCLNARLQAGY